jgi:hypothetical protein
MRIQFTNENLVLAALSCFCFAACGDDTGAGDASVNDSATDADMGTSDAGMDGTAPDAGDAGFEIEMRGTVYGEGAPDREPDAGVTPWPDGGMAPDGSVATPGGRIIGASVHLKDLDGTVLSTTMTDGVGEYALRVPRDTLTFVHVEPVTGYAGTIRAEETRGDDYEAFDLVLQTVAGLESLAASAGITRDATRGWIACGFNPVDNMAGGDGAELAAGITHDPAFNITDVGVIPGNRLVPLCESGGGNPPGALPGATCTMDDRARQVFFPNVLETAVPVMPLDPATGTCSQRFSVDSWLTAPGALTVINIDCAP